MDYPHVILLVVTFKRYDELKQTLDALIEHIDYPADKLHFVVSDDSTPDGRKMSNLGRIKAYDHIHFVVTPQRMGWGAHVNWAMTEAMTHVTATTGSPAPYLFFIEDDYVLTRPLDLKRGIALMDARPNVGMLRYRGTAGTHMVYHQFEADIADYLPDYRENVGQTPHRITYLQFDSGSPTLWLYSNGAHLKRMTGEKAFHDAYGLYPTTLSMGELEEAYAHQVKNRMRSNQTMPAIAILPDWIHMHFDHIGQTFQNSEDDISDGS